MNGNKDKGGVSEYSPSFRVVCRVSKNTIKGTKVKKFGVVYAIKGETVGKDREQLEKLMTKEGASGNSNVKVHEETPNGVYKDWSTKAVSYTHLWMCMWTNHRISTGISCSGRNGGGVLWNYQLPCYINAHFL